MKKIILLVICILGLTGCSDNEMEAPAYVMEGYTEIISMDSIHLYRVGRNYEKDSYVLSKIVCSSREKVWEENVKLTDSVSVNIGYGDVITCYLQDISPFVESKELFMIEISYNPHNVTCYKIHSTENGSLLNSFQFTYPILLYRGYVRWNNGDIIIPAIYEQNISSRRRMCIRPCDEYDFRLSEWSEIHKKFVRRGKDNDERSKSSHYLYALF